MSSEHDEGRAGERTGGAANTDGPDGPVVAGSGAESAAEHGERQGRRRGPRLTIAAVAAAVLLAGGGGAWWAAADGGSGSGGPAPLRIAGPDVPVPGGGSTDSASAGGAAYRLTGTLPQGPKHAPVYRPDGVGQDAVRKLADALGMTGAVTSSAGSWQVAPPKQGPALLVDKGAVGTWSYARAGAPAIGARPDSGPAGNASGSTSSTSSTGAGESTATGSVTVHPGAPATPSPPGAVSVPVMPVAPSPGTGGSAPVDEQRARQAAAPVLAALGLSGARVDAAQTVGPMRLVTADPVVGGLPTHGWTTQLEIGPDGTIALGYGRLAPLAKGDDYPVISAAGAFKQLSARLPGPVVDDGLANCVVPMHGGQGLARPQATPTVPGQDRTLPRTLPCVPGNGHPVQVRGATFGLAAEFVSGTQALVPAWLFDTAPAGVARTSVVAQTAVDPSYIATGGPSAGGPGMSDPGQSSPGQSSPGQGAPGQSTPSAPASPGVPVNPGGPVNPGVPVNPGGPREPDPGMPADPKAPQHIPVTGYRAAGTTLTLTFWGGECDTYKATVVESADSVRVTVTATPKNTGTQQMCPMIARQFTASVHLAQPLGDRTVVNATDGQPVRGQ